MLHFLMLFLETVFFIGLAGIIGGGNHGFCWRLF